jgi:peptidoglycan/xylan/chitin deacetylase (PgdA/CDA1 family)
MTSLQSARRGLKYAAIRGGLEATALSGAARLLPSSGGRGMIFTLHHVRPPAALKFAPNAILSVTPAFLEQAILTARACGLVPARLHDLPALLSDPSDKRRFVAFTLDDGYRNNAQFAAPVFRKFGIPYTIFITPGFVERSRTIWWETAEAITRKLDRLAFDFGSGAETLRMETAGEKFTAFERLAAHVRAIDEDRAVEEIDTVAAASGIDPTTIVEDLVMDEAGLRMLAADPLADFGAHTLTHVNLKRVTPERLKHEIEESARLVGRYGGRAPRSFSYPYGWKTAAGEREARAAAEAGFAAAVTTQPGVLGAACLEQPMLLPRVSLNGYYQKSRYVRALISGLPFRFMR